MCNTKRINYFDTIKGVMILLVVLGHFIDMRTGSSKTFKSLFLFIYAFHMPMFFIISGYFHSHKNIANKVYFFLVTGVLTKLLIFFTRSFILREDASFSLFSENGTPWYMYAMAVFILLSYLLRTIDIRVVFAIGLIIGCFCGYDARLGDDFILSRIFVFFPFYSLGILIKEYIDPEKLGRGLLAKILSPAVILIWFASCFIFLDQIYLLRRFFTGRTPFINIPDPIYSQFGLPIRLGCYLLSALLCFAFLAITTNRKNFLTGVGSRSLQVYFWHRPILYILSHFGLHNICATVPGMAIYLFIALALGLILSLKIISYPTDALRKICIKNKHIPTQ
ncbi:MAG: acyltransferase family protein [Clostridia bacterium]|nr:acyltransferase family protein [Clostridia bacterium]